MNDLVKLIMNKHNLDFNEANLVSNLVKKICKDEDFYSEFINELRVFHDKKTTANWISSTDNILVDALEEEFINNDRDINSDLFFDILIQKYIEDDSNLIEVSDSLYVAWED